MGGDEGVGKRWSAREEVGRGVMLMILILILILVLILVLVWFWFFWLPFWWKENIVMCHGDSFRLGGGWRGEGGGERGERGERGGCLILS